MKTVPISALQHLLFCERQAALIHVEQVWLDDGATASGLLLHARVNRPGFDHRGTNRVERSVALASERLGLSGIADTVEFWPGSPERVVPVEYKRGTAKHQLADQVQLCAQALCLEEMLGVTIETGAVFYGASHRRVDVPFSADLRTETENAARRMHQLFDEGHLPIVRRNSKCEKCSLLSVCLPDSPFRKFTPQL